MTHYVPPFYLYRTDYVTEQMQRIMELKRIFNIHDVYNELFRALAWNGRDEEFLSLWQEAEKCIYPLGSDVGGILMVSGSEVYLAFLCAFISLFYTSSEVTYSGSH